MKMTPGKYRLALNTPTTTFSRPWVLYKQSFCGWSVVGSYRTLATLNAAAKRYNIELIGGEV